MARSYRKLKLPLIKPQDIDRFWSYVDKTPGQGPNGDCWEWQGTQTPKGYGHIMLGSRKDGSLRPVQAHRVSYYLQHSVDPIGQMICHRCDNPSCVRPDHLFMGTQQDNVDDCIQKGRRNPAGGDRHKTRRHPELITRGEDHPRAKLTESQVGEILDQIEQGVCQRRIAERFNVSPAIITMIKKKRVWRHLL